MTQGYCRNTVDGRQLICRTSNQQILTVLYRTLGDQTKTQTLESPLVFDFVVVIT